MAEPAKRKTSYDDLKGLPEHVTGEIIDGELIATPRPSARHTHVESALAFELGPPYRFGRGGPGGWILLIETEIMLGEHLLVPDLSGWRRERFPGVQKENWISVTPDWVCEVLSPGTARVDKVRKMPIYAEHGVPHFWLVDPAEKTLEVFRLELGRWTLLSSHAEAEKIRCEPFREIEISLGDLWID